MTYEKSHAIQLWREASTARLEYLQGILRGCGDDDWHYSYGLVTDANKALACAFSGFEQAWGYIPADEAGG